MPIQVLPGSPLEFPIFWHGIDFLVIVIGLFGMGELITLVEHQITGKLKVLPVGKSFELIKGSVCCYNGS